MSISLKTHPSSKTSSLHVGTCVSVWLKLPDRKQKLLQLHKVYLSDNFYVARETKTKLLLPVKKIRYQKKKTKIHQKKCPPKKHTTKTGKNEKLALIPEKSSSY